MKMYDIQFIIVVPGRHDPDIVLSINHCGSDLDSAKRKAEHLWKGLVPPRRAEGIRVVEKGRHERGAGSLAALPLGRLIIN
jgi:hypothetical protein